MKRLRTVSLFLVLGAALLMAAGAKEGKTRFPNGDLTFLIPNAPGGGNDLIVRALIPGQEGSTIPTRAPTTWTSRSSERFTTKPECDIEI